ncbi:gamma-glutamyltransferase family protein [Hydrogenophaga sp. YM1]|uniref:gamma-glutamyltransferase family protein n=1 Tax=Hydrogenophaga sp. YM1 TaxID=2806262 RepID=UPI00195B62D8|nr:gamma-glutamyltransferase family protein [Hydrogenophaga sp. YM1]QRR35912.1 gamma-glutamyltransferase family protein [Hydrogenophaga sp. YM1]
MRFSDWNNPYPVSRAPLMARNAVATTQPLAAMAGLRMLLKGGNAIDAAIATAAALTVVEPCSNGLGSDNFAIVWDGERLHGMNSSGVAPMGWSKAYFDQKHGGQMPLRGFDAVTVPGAVGGWAALSERFGALPFADLMAPAIELAERGHAVAPVIAKKWAQAVPLLRDKPGFAQAFLPRGRAPQAGERFAFPDAARALRAIAQTRGEAFYRGEIAAAIEAFAREHGAQLRASDLAAHQAQWVRPIEIGFAGHTVHELPPNGQGIAALMALGMLEQLDIGRFGADSIEGQHLQIEAMKLAFADTYRWVADERYMTEVTAADLLDPAYLRERAQRIDPKRAIDPGPGEPPRGGTVYLTTADAQGRMVSLIQSNYLGFGSGVVVPGWGVSLQNRGHGFTLQDGHPNQVAPGKRPFHTIIPGFLTRGGQPVMGFGVMGANMQPQGHVQTLVRMLVHGQQPQAASDAPRWKWGKGLDVDFESTMNPALREGLKALGHRFEPTADSYLDFGSGQFIARLSDDLEDGYVAASDSRRDGQAVGF